MSRNIAFNRDSVFVAFVKRLVSLSSSHQPGTSRMVVPLLTSVSMSTRANWKASSSSEKLRLVSSMLQIPVQCSEADKCRDHLGNDGNDRGCGSKCRDRIHDVSEFELDNLECHRMDSQGVCEIKSDAEEGVPRQPAQPNRHQPREQKVFLITCF